MVSTSASIWVGCHSSVSPFQTGTPAYAASSSTTCLAVAAVLDAVEHPARAPGRCPSPTPCGRSASRPGRGRWWRRPGRRRRPRRRSGSGWRSSRRSARCSCRAAAAPRSRRAWPPSARAASSTRWRNSSAVKSSSLRKWRPVRSMAMGVLLGRAERRHRKSIRMSAFLYRRLRGVIHARRPRGRHGTRAVTAAGSEDAVGVRPGRARPGSSCSAGRRGPGPARCPGSRSPRCRACAGRCWS